MNRAIAPVLAALLACATGVAAQPRAERGAGPAGRTYDPKTVQHVAGEVVRVDRVPSSPRGRGRGVHLVLRTAPAETLAVHLGPAWYVDRQPVKIAAGDRIEVDGSRVTIDGTPVLIAARVTKGGETLVLRDDRGVPAWRGRRSGGGRP